MTPVWAFDIEAATPAIRKDLVVGAFVNMETGDLWYYLTNSKAPAYAVDSDETDIVKKFDKFMTFRQVLKTAQTEVDEVKQAMQEPFCVKEKLDACIEAVFPLKAQAPSPEPADESVSEEPVNEQE